MSATLCMRAGCSEEAIFGFKEGLYCAAHKSAGMLKYPDIYCMTPGCTVMASHGNPVILEPLRCDAHKRNDDCNLKETRMCPNCYSLTFLNSYGFCLFCSKQDAMDKFKKRHVKEMSKFLESIGMDALFFDDTDEGIRPRPRFEIELQMLKIVIEIFEFGYPMKLYEDVYDEDKYYKMYQQHSQKNMLVIRFNPSGYHSKSGEFVLDRDARYLYLRALFDKIIDVQAHYSDEEMLNVVDIAFDGFDEDLSNLEEHKIDIDGIYRVYD